ncbi:MAG: tetratricopeptide repeat protein [Maricaulaceae bacterium]
MGPVAWFERINAWAEPIAAQLNAPIWVVAGGAYGLVASVAGIFGQRAHKRWMARVESGQAELTERARAAETAQDETREVLERHSQLLEQVLAQINAQSSVSGVEVDMSTKSTIRETVEILAAAPEAEKRAALSRAAQGDLAGAADDLARWAEHQRLTGAGTDDAAETFREAGALAFNTDTERALRNYESARTLDPDNPQTWRQLGALYLRLGRFDEAQAAYEGAADRAPDDRETANALTGLGAIAQRRGRLDDAEDAYRRALSLFETLGDAGGQSLILGNIALISRSRGATDQARAQLGQALTLSEAVGDADTQGAQHISLGLIAAAEEDFERADRHYARALELYESVGNVAGTASVYGNLGTVAQKRGDFEAAENHTRRALELAEQLDDAVRQANCWHALGTIAMRTNDNDAAVERLTRALEINRTIGDAAGEASQLVNLGLIARQREQIEDACAAWRRALSLYTELGHAAAQKVEKLLAETGCTSTTEH